MTQEFKNKWVAALRSGEYKQGFRRLYDYDDNSYCCVGVAHSLCGVSQRILVHRYNLLVLPDHESKEVNDLGISQLRVLANMNDRGKTFSEIADYIEQNL